MNGARQSLSLSQAQRLPWTHEGLEGWLRRRQHENLPMGATPDEEDTEFRGRRTGRWLVCSLGRMRHDKSRRKLEMHPNSSSSLAQPSDEGVLSQPVEKTHMQVKQTVRKVSKKLNEVQIPKVTCSILEHVRRENSASRQKSICEPTWAVRGEPSCEKGKSR